LVIQGRNPLHASGARDPPVTYKDGIGRCRLVMDGNVHLVASRRPVPRLPGLAGYLEARTSPRPSTVLGVPGCTPYARSMRLELAPIGPSCSVSRLRSRGRAERFNASIIQDREGTMLRRDLLKGAAAGGRRKRRRNATAALRTYRIAPACR